MQMDQSNYSGAGVQPPVRPGPLPAPQQIPPSGVKRSGMAIASLVLGILGLLTCGVGSLVGLILGIVSLSAIKKSAGKLAGQGLAIAGIVVSAIVLAVVPIIALLVAILVPAVSRAQDHARQAVASVNMHQVGLAAMMYASDNEGYCPDPDNWLEQIRPYLGDNPEEVLESPFNPEAGRAIAMNASLVKSEQGRVVPLRLHEVPDQTVLFFEAEYGSPLSGGPELLPAEPRGPKGYVIGFVGGDVEAVPSDELDRLIWSPGAQ